MLLSLDRVLDQVYAADTGIPRQWDIFEDVRRRTGRIPPIIDARDVLEDPEAMLRALCRAIGIEFDGRMLSWPAGPRETDGVWAKYWYDNVHASRGFKSEGRMNDDLQALHDQLDPIYQQLREQRLKPETA
jgi:hypothetical protein